MTTTSSPAAHANRRRTGSALLQLLDHARIGPRHFRGRQPDDEKLQVFGGQALAQALRAATLTVDPVFVPHSMHAYFLVKGDARAPIDFHVEDIRRSEEHTSE